MTTFDADSVTWAFDAPTFCDLSNPEEPALQWNDSWFNESSSELSQSRNIRRLRARPTLPQTSRLLTAPPRQFSILSRPVLASRPLPAPSRPIQVRSTPARTGRDIVAALASAQQNQSVKQPPIQNVEEKPVALGRFAQPTAASLNKARTTGKRDVATEIKRITSRFAKKPQDKVSASSLATAEQSISKKDKEVDRGSLTDNNKENVPPHRRGSVIPYPDRHESTQKQSEVSSLLSGQEHQEISKETTGLEDDHVSHQEDLVDQEQQIQHEEVELDKEIIHQMDTGTSRSLAQELASQRESIRASVVDNGHSALAQELASQRESIRASVVDNGPSAHAAAILSPSRQSKVSQQEQSLTSTTIRVGRERMRQWLDDQMADPDTVDTDTPTKLRTPLARSPEIPRSEPVRAQSFHTDSGRDSPELVPVSSNVDALLERMDALRSRLLEVVNTSSIKPTEPSMIRSKQHLETPSGEKGSNYSLSDGAAIDRRLAQARRVLEESKRGSKKWFVKDPNRPVPPIMAPKSTKRKAPVEENVRPSKITKSFSVLSAELRDTLSRRDSMDNNLSIVERVEKLKQSASRRTSRVSSIRSVYLPVAPTVPKSPAFATDARSRLSTREHYN